MFKMFSCIFQFLLTLSLDTGFKHFFLTAFNMAAECHKVMIKVTEMEKNLKDTFILDYFWGFFKSKILTLRKGLYAKKTMKSYVKSKRILDIAID